MTKRVEIYDSSCKHPNLKCGYAAGCRCERCYEAKRAYDRSRYAKNPEPYRRWNAESLVKRNKLLNDLKSERGCERCGWNENPIALQFHHTNGDKIKAVAKLKSYSLEDVLAEVDKCVVLCANCHAITTWGER